MRFEYECFISTDPMSGELLEIQRPVVPITIYGPAGEYHCAGLVDSGADFTILPKEIAAFLGIDTSPTMGSAQTAGGHDLQTRFGNVVFGIGDEEEQLTWEATVLFFESDESTALLGHAGFLHYFRALFDGYSLTLTLEPVEDFPHQHDG